MRQGFRTRVARKSGLGLCVCCPRLVARRGPGSRCSALQAYDLLSVVLRCRRSNNNVSDWKEFERLKELPELKDLLMVNTPLYNSIATDADDSEWRMEVLKRLPNLKKLDGKDVTDDELEAAMA